MLSECGRRVKVWTSRWPHWTWSGPRRGPKGLRRSGLDSDARVRRTFFSPEADEMWPRDPKNAVPPLLFSSPRCYCASRNCIYFPSESPRGFVNAAAAGAVSGTSGAVRCVRSHYGAQYTAWSGEHVTACDTHDEYVLSVDRRHDVRDRSVSVDFGRVARGPPCAERGVKRTRGTERKK